MAILDLARPVKVTVEIPTVPGVHIDLFLRLPTWEERAAMFRAQTEHQMKLQFIYDSYAKGGGDEAMKNLKPEEQKQFLSELRAAESSFEDVTATDCLKYLTGFQDKKDGEVIFAFEGKDVLASDSPDKWKPILSMYLGSALSRVWKDLLEKSSASSSSVQFTSNLIKN